MDSGRDPSDPALAALLRSHSRETPPPHVDAAILAAAHRAVDSAPRGAVRAPASRFWRWWMPLAAAAAITTVVIGVLPLTPVESDFRPPDASDSSAGGPATPPAPFPTQERGGPAPAAASRERPAAETAPASKPQRQEAAATAGAASGVVVAPATRPAADWITRMRALRSEGKTHEAEQELARFRAAFSDADARLPADLRSWADSLRH